MLEKEMLNSGKKKHFVLVHGFGHGAWCWYKVVTLLKMKGERVTALDMAGCGVDPKQFQDVSSIFTYVQPLMDFIASLPEDEKVILVGHSYGGIPISLAMEKFPEKISLAVFVTAFMPNCTEPTSALIHEFFRRSSTTLFMDSAITFDEGVPISGLLKPDFMAAKLYRNCSLEVLELAKTLMRPNMFFMEELGKKCLVTQERYGSLKRCYVVCQGDEVVLEQFQRYSIENSPPNEVISIPGAAHMVMLSKPLELCSCLIQLSHKY